MACPDVLNETIPPFSHNVIESCVTASAHSLVLGSTIYSFLLSITDHSLSFGTHLQGLLLSLLHIPKLLILVDLLSPFIINGLPSEV